MATRATPSYYFITLTPPVRVDVTQHDGLKCGVQSIKTLSAHNLFTQVCGLVAYDSRNQPSRAAQTSSQSAIVCSLCACIRIMLARIALIAFYGIAVALMSVYLHLGSLYDQILLDSVPTRSYEYIIGKCAVCIT